jgi:hypothetical protein
VKGLPQNLERKIMEKVFSTKAFINDCKHTGEEYQNSIDNGWPAECEGKTLKEIRAMHYGVEECWMIEPAKSWRDYKS